MYKSYLILINDYFCSVSKNYMFDIVFPLTLSVLSAPLIYFDLMIIDKAFVTNLLSVIGIIAGFSISAIALITSSDSESINKLKNKNTKISIDGLVISVFRRFYILISYSVLISFIAIIINVFGISIPWSRVFSKLGVTILKSMDLLLFLHIFFINIRNVTSLYFIYFNETNS